MDDVRTVVKDLVGDRGLRCRKCGCGRFRVIYTRSAPGAKLVRRRECRNCKARLTTWERVIG
jgi:transcriptional regulator NrdR family protein